MKKSKQAKGSVGPIVLLCLFAIAILAVCASYLSWNAGRPKPPESSSARSGADVSSSASGGASSSQGAQAGQSSKPVSSGQQKPAASSASQSSAAGDSQSASQSANTPAPSKGPDGTYLLNNEDDIRAAAYDQMNDDNKAAVLGNWKSAAIRTVNLRGPMGDITDLNYVGLDVYAVDFKRTDRQGVQPDNMVAFLAMDTGKLIGFGYVD